MSSEHATDITEITEAIAWLELQFEYELGRRLISEAAHDTWELPNVVIRSPNDSYSSVANDQCIQD